MPLRSNFQLPIIFPSSNVPTFQALANNFLYTIPNCGCCYAHTLFHVYIYYNTEGKGIQKKTLDKKKLPFKIQAERVIKFRLLPPRENVPISIHMKC